ncbi:MAG: tetratricopeptide repeat protein, partial [Bryobacteraceae bacterium]
MIAKAAQQDYSRDEVRRMLEISARQLREWQRQKLIRETDQFSFADLIALRTVQKLRENRVPARRIARALESLKKKLAGVEQPLSELKIVSNGRSIEVQVAGQKMEPITGQMLFDFDTAGLDNLKPFPGERVKEPSSRLSDERQAELWFQRGLDLEERGAPVAEAIAAYEKAIAHNPNAAGALVNLGTIYYHLRRYPEAEAQYQRAIEVDARYPLAQFN